MDIMQILFILIILLGLTVAVLITRLFYVRRSLADILRVLEDLEKGNENRKVLVKRRDRIAQIGYKMNAIVEANKSRVIALEKSERAYKQLLTNLSHDLRTPLTSLIGYLDAVHSRIVTGREKDEYIEIVRKKAYNLKDFVDILFEWFKLDAKERNFHFQTIDLNELTRNILVDWISVFDENMIDFHIDIPERECRIPVDINGYTRIINNLIQNALLHSGGNQIHISVEPKDGCVIIKISDNGTGIEEKEIPLIFDRLYKCDKARSGKGNGLGLAIVKELVAGHGGTISVSSIPQKKTIFMITLPIEKVRAL